MADIKGISKRVIEITEPQHAYIERVFVVLRSDAPAVRVGTRRSEAEKYVAGLMCWRRAFVPHSAKGWCILLGGAAVTAVLAAAIFLL